MKINDRVSCCAAFKAVGGEHLLAEKKGSVHRSYIIQAFDGVKWKEAKHYFYMSFRGGRERKGKENNVNNERRLMHVGSAREAQKDSC